MGGEEGVGELDGGGVVSVALGVFCWGGRKGRGRKEGRSEVGGGLGGRREERCVEVTVTLMLAVQTGVVKHSVGFLEEDSEE